MFNLLFCLKIKSVEELDSLYEIIDDHGSWVEIRKKDDESYWKNREKIDVYTFSVGVRKLCSEKKMQLCFTPWDKAYPDVKSIFSYMKKIGCSDLILDLLVDTAKMAKYPNKKFNQKNRTYDENGKLIK